MKTKTIVILSSSLVILAFIGMVILMGVMVKEANECTANPFVYSAKALEKAGAEYTCTCNPLRPDVLPFTFTKDGLVIGDLFDYNNQQEFKELDVSNITLELKGGNDYGS